MKYTVSDTLFLQYPDLCFALAAVKWIDNTIPLREADLFLERSSMEASLRQKTGILDVAGHLAPYKQILETLHITASFPAEAILNAAASGKDISRGTAADHLITGTILKYEVPVIAIDTESGKKAVALRPTEADDVFQATEDSEEEHPTPGEWVFTKNHTVCVRHFFCTPGTAGALTEDSENLLFLIPGFASQNKKQILSARNELARRMKDIFKCNAETAFLDKDTPEFISRI